MNSATLVLRKVKLEIIQLMLTAQINAIDRHILTEFGDCVNSLLLHTLTLGNKNV